LGTDEKLAKHTEQGKTADLRTRIENLRAEGKTYRQIAEMERVSIAQISRLLKKPAVTESSVKPESTGPETDGEDASRIFEEFEKGVSLPKVVIQLRTSPDKVRQLYDKWIGLKKIDVNQPTVLEKIKELDELLAEEIASSVPLRMLFGQARGMGGLKLRKCGYVNAEGFCTNWVWKRKDGSEVHKQAEALRCAFCYDFNAKESDS
jgi:hypothetical protein